jgi:nucleolysin TIA-1/TIAR
MTAMDESLRAADVDAATGALQTMKLNHDSNSAHSAPHSPNGDSKETPANNDGEPHLPPSEAGLLTVSNDGSLNGNSADDGNEGRSSASGSASSSSQNNKTLYLGNLHPFVTEAHLRELFAGLMGINELKVIKDKATGVSAGYGFAKFTEQAFAQIALDRVNKAMLFGQEIRVNWAFLKEQPEEVANLVHIFVGDLAPDVTDAVLMGAFQGCRGIADARVQWDHATGRSRGYGFVSFHNTEDGEASIAAMHGQFVGSRRVRCGWAQHKTTAALPTDAHILTRADPTNTNIYVGNLAASLSDAEVRRHFATFGPLAEVKLHRKGGFGFVRYKSHDDAVLAIVGMNGAVLAGRQLKCSWGRHPNTPPSGVQASLMLAAAAGNGGQLIPQMGNFMAGSVLGMPMATGGATGVLQGQTMQSLQLGGGGGGGNDGLGGGGIPLEHMYGAPGGYAMAGPYGNMGAQMFYNGQSNQ